MANGSTGTFRDKEEFRAWLMNTRLIGLEFITISAKELEWIRELLSGK